MFYNLKDTELDDYIYRIISLERFLELFAMEENTLVKPCRWEDTFENFILKSKVKLKSGEILKYNYHERIYGQCWTLEASLDAMWRIYSPNREGLRIRTTIRKLLESIYNANSQLAQFTCCLGKVEYKSTCELRDYANSIFDYSGISVENIFKSLLVKRNPFKHENEVRLLYDNLDDYSVRNVIYSYKINPHDLISQVVIDPRKSHSEFEKIKNIILKLTNYSGEIKRSSLYTLPKDIILDVTDF